MKHAARPWVRHSLEIIAAEATRSGETNLLTFPLPQDWGIDLYLKDESAHPTGSLKHRLARSLFVYGLCNGWIQDETVIIEASSGSTAVSEAYFARLLGLAFVAVVPSSTSPRKIALIEHFGGRCEFVSSAAEAPRRAAELSDDTGGHFMDQFKYAERASDWRGPGTIADSLFAQLTLERHPEPEWIVVGAGTGGTAATLGRYLRWTGRRSRLCVVDPPGSVFTNSWRATRNLPAQEVTGEHTLIEGIGRPHLEESFLPSLVDAMLPIPDEASIAALHLLERQLGQQFGGSTGTNLIGALAAVGQLRDSGRTGSIVTLICDSGDRYLDTIWSTTWLDRQCVVAEQWTAQLAAFLDGAPFPISIHDHSGAQPLATMEAE